MKVGWCRGKLVGKIVEGGEWQRDEVRGEERRKSVVVGELEG